MIKLERIKTAPPVHANFFGKRREDLNFKLLQLKRNGILEEDAGSDKWDSSIWKQAKEQLLAETNGKCAYCETPTDVVDYGDVEHFRPKSKYWWLAYCYDNYLASCALCNQKYKSNDFPLRSGYSPIKGVSITARMTDAQLQKLSVGLTVDPVSESTGMSYKIFHEQLSSEWALLVNPYYEDPTKYFAYKVIFENREVHVIPKSKKYADVVEAADEQLGINRAELLDLRFQRYLVYMTHRHTLEDSGISAFTRNANQLALDRMLVGKEAYTGMIRYFHSQKLADLPFDLESLQIA